MLADQSVTLAWDPNPEPDVNGYSVYYGTFPRIYTQSTNVGNVTVATVYGLPEGATHYFALTAKNTSGLESDFSNEITNVIPANITNFAPQIWTVGNMTLIEGQSTNFVVQIWDVETHPDALVLTATSTNQALLPDDHIVVVGLTHDRLVNLELIPGQSGQTLVTLTVSDGTKAASASFVLTVIHLPKPPIVWVRSIYQVGPSRNGPWKYVTSDFLPITMDTNWFYKSW
jgi:hypothetical protein